MVDIQSKLQEITKSKMLAKALIEVGKSEPLVQTLIESSDEKTFINKAVCTIILLADQNIEQCNTVTKLIKGLDPKVTKTEQT
jgi:hypothetical protein